MHCRMLSFAGGVMVSIVCFGLIPESLHLAGIQMTILGLVLGVLILMPLNRIVDKLTAGGEKSSEVHQTVEELLHADGVIHNSQALLRSGIIMIVAIALHNMPEGIAIGAGGSHDSQLGMMMALMIGLHNIPEGLAITAPLIIGGVPRTRAVLITALSGTPTLIGCLIGMLIGTISDAAIALSLASAGGAMLYVVFGEIIPQSVVMTRSRSVTMSTLVGILVGFMIAVM
ncbi:MAG: ZIP family metal transporter, partial [Symbiobacteriaceae bacterium]|nr:ZIP family metal transporter [Symbiobacteriaceae bacterium]